MYLVVLVKASRLGTMICVQRQKAQRPKSNVQVECPKSKGHHRALAGGTSTLQLQPGSKDEHRHHRALAGGTSTLQLQPGSKDEYRHHRALAGGTST